MRDQDEVEAEGLGSDLQIEGADGCTQALEPPQLRLDLDMQRPHPRNL
ncbi:MAG: hypothetical protein IVW51_13285 [Thermaceae bacterium]|nr:hypothetical protein [Thermaceae bacterium]